MKIESIALEGIPEVVEGDDIAELIASSARSSATELRSDQIVVIAQKVVSKAEGRFRDLAAVDPTAEADSLAEKTEKDPRLVQLILEESREVLRAVPGVLVVETVHGFVCANAGIDASNVPGDGVLLLPLDSDASARRIRAGLRDLLGVAPAVIVTDSFGRAWRSGQVDVAIGCAGIDPLLDLRGASDVNGRELSATITAVADEVAAAADLARSKDGHQPVVVVGGRPDLVMETDGPGAGSSLRDRAQDLFR